MRKLILAVFLIVVSNITLAASDRWLKVDGNSDLAMFIDLATLDINKNIVKAWILVNYSSPQKGDEGTFLSVKHFDMFDCNSREKQNLYFSAYEKNNGDGKLMAAEKMNDISPVVPGTMTEKIFNSVCK